MFYKIKKSIDKSLNGFTKTIYNRYGLKKISPLLHKTIKDFITRKGKRLRPAFFILGYKGFSSKSPPGLYTCALGIELLHDFFLVHDDLVDKSDTRRGKPSMHKVLEKHLAKCKNIKFSGEDSSLIAGDVIYAMAMDAFFSIKEHPSRKEKALHNFIKTALLTASGEFLEILTGAKKLNRITKDDIYKIYDYKTAHYTFVSPLTTGAILAGAGQKQIDKLFNFGIYLGRAFQIKDDILGMFGDEKKIGKSILSDLQEAKKTLLIWQAYKNCGKKYKSTIDRILTKKKIYPADLTAMRKIIVESGSLRYAEKEIKNLTEKAKTALSASSLRKQHKKTLLSYSETITKTG